MKVSVTYSDIWKIAYPIILGSLATTVLNLTDTAFIARVGETELGAMAIATVFYFVIVMIGLALGTGSQIIMARRAGEGNIPEIGKVFDHSFLLLLLLSLISFIAVKFFSPQLLRSMLHSEGVANASNAFMSIRCYGIFFAMATVTFRSFFVAIGKTRVITYASILTMCLNVILAYLFIFGHYGFPEMGIKGAALASVIAEFAGLIYLVIFSGLKHEFRQFRLLRFEDFSYPRFSAIVHLSSPVMLQNTLSMGAWFLFFVFIERMGEHALAISNIIRATYMILMTPIWGFASATNSMVSNIIGQGKEYEVRLLVKKIIYLSLAVTGGIFLVTFISPQWILRITTSDAKLISDSIGCYYIITGAMFLFSISVILLSAVSGSGNTRAAMVIELLNIIIYMIYVYLCAVTWNASIEAVWFSEIVYWVLMGVFSFIYLSSRNWQPKRI